MNLIKDTNIRQIENEIIIKKRLQTYCLTGMLNRYTPENTGDTYKAGTLLYRIIVVLFMKKPLRVLWETQNSIADCLKGARKDAYYNLLKNSKCPWRKILYRVFKKTVKPLQALSDLSEQVLILDDTTNAKTGKKIELLSMQYDHVEHRYYKGFTQVHLGWSDGASYLPVDFSIKVGNKVVSTYQKPVDKRTSGYKRRLESRQTKLDQAISMLKRAEQEGIAAGYVVYDTWFAKPCFVWDVYETGYHSVAQISRGDRIWQVNYQGHVVTLKQLYRQLQATKQFNKIKVNNETFLAATVNVTHHNGLDMRLVFCRKPHQKEWHVFLSTDVEMDVYQILRTYSKRWSIESFFKNCKQLIQFGREQSIDFDVQIAMTTIRLMVYSMASMILREQEDERTFGELFAIIQNQFSHLNLDREILEMIFSLILEHLSVSTKVLQEFKIVFEYICDHFSSSGLWQKSCQAA